LRPAASVQARGPGSSFAGLRAKEISRLDWREVKVDRGFIEVTALKSKTASRRLVRTNPT
jgi:hypothetical protein